MQTAVTLDTHNLAPSILTEKQLVNFHNKVDRSRGADACWPWLAYTCEWGYGTFAVERKATKAHRVAWMLKNGTIPTGLCVCHKCDNPPCCNPAHLFLGTVGDNNRDKQLKGRGRAQRGPYSGPVKRARGDEHWTRKQPHKLIHGQAHKRAKLTDELVHSIKVQRSVHACTYDQLAVQYNVSAGTIAHILQGKIWKHVVVV